MNTKMRVVITLLLLVVFLASCNLPRSETGEGLSLTAAAQTIQALTSATPFGGLTIPGFTATVGGPAITLTPSLTLPPPNTNTPAATATSNCNIAQFVTDVTIPDGTIMTPNQTFTKTWRFKNVGTCTWTPSYAVVFSNGTSMNGPVTQALTGNVNPGQTVDISVNLTAPSSAGDYTGYWRIRDGSGVLFNQFYVQIKVQNPVTATYTLPPAIVFAVTTVTFNVTGTCPNFNYTVNVTTNAAGTVELHRVFSDGATDTAPRTLVFASAGTQSFSEPVYFGVAGSSSWTDIYIDSPNHQQFGRATFTCP